MSEDEDCVKDFMLEHSILDRILLIFENLIKNNKIIDCKYLKILILIIKIFIENHHEKMEELYVFPTITSNNKNFEDHINKLSILVLCANLFSEK